MNRITFRRSNNNVEANDNALLICTTSNEKLLEESIIETEAKKKKKKDNDDQLEMDSIEWNKEKNYFRSEKIRESGWKVSLKYLSLNCKKK